MLSFVFYYNLLKVQVFVITVISFYLHMCIGAMFYGIYLVIKRPCLGVGSSILPHESCGPNSGHQASRLVFNLLIHLTSYCLLNSFYAIQKIPKKVSSNHFYYCALCNFYAISCAWDFSDKRGLLVSH